MKYFLLFLLLNLLLASCATRAPEVDMSTVMSAELAVEEVVETATESNNVWYWNTTPTAVSLSDEEWKELFGLQESAQKPSEQIISEESIIEKSSSVVEIPIAEELSVTEENPVGTTAISETEPIGVEEQKEPSAEVQAEVLTMTLANVAEEEVFSAETPPFRAVTIVDETVPEETVSADEITEIAAQYKALEKTDFAKPAFKDKVLSFLKEHLLYLEMSGLIILAVAIAVIFIKRGKKARAQAQETPVLDETLSFYKSPTIEVEEPIPKF